VKAIIRILVRFGLLPEKYRERKWPEIKIHDCRKGLPFKNGEVEVIYSSHFFEHVHRHEAFFILKDCFRTLKWGGTIRIALPDVKKIVWAYVNGDMSTLRTRDLTDDMVPFGLCDFLMMQFYPVELNESRPPGFIRKLQEVALARHKWMYDAHTFTTMMERAGFSAIEEKECGESRIEEAALLDLKPETTFYLEADKQ
jgi:hypothetical protein